MPGPQDVPQGHLPRRRRADHPHARRARGRRPQAGAPLDHPAEVLGPRQHPHARRSCAEGTGQGSPGGHDFQPGDGLHRGRDHLRQRKGAYTGAVADRPGLLRAADGGLLFLDEIGELGLDMQAMLLHTLEGKRFLPLGADTEVNSRFQLIAGTNRDLGASVAAGGFRENLLACINLWTFELPPLRDRREDIEPNLDYEIEQFASRSSRIVRFTTETRRMYLAFAMSHRAGWNGNFRDLSASVSRMATLAPSGRITDDVVGREIQRLESLWGRVPTEAAEPDGSALSGILSADRLANLDRFDRVQLRDVLSVCLECRSLSDAGRELFAASRERRSSVNDADRLRKYLSRFGLSWKALHPELS
ncbi:MAG: sigma 54-interacting transcriptional regulator [Phycisphaerales bacterium]|nr:sigma 54-interacting transcriptional regulator [Phycisphaerales bacterium]